MSQANTKHFDFSIFDALMKNAGPGLKLIIAKQLLGDVASSAAHFKHPLAKDHADVTIEVEGLRAMWKAIAADVNRTKKVAA